MFEDATWAVEAPWPGDDPWASVTALPSMPEQPAWLADEPEPDREAEALALDSARAELPPEARFVAEYGRPATPEELDRFAPASTEAAAWLQEVAVQAASVRALADARRIEALLTALEASIAT